MRSLRRILAATLCSGLLLAARSGDVSEYKGEQLTSEDGVVILQVVLHRGEGSMSKTLNREDQTLVGVIREVSGNRKMVVSNIDTIKAFVLPAGRWYVAELRTAGERDWPPIAKPMQSFEVVGDHINYAGSYSVQFAMDSSGRASSDVSVEFEEDLVKAAADAYPDLFKTKQLLYCPIARKCKPPSEFKQ